MDPKTSAAEFSHQGYDINENFLNSTDSPVAAMKSLSALISPGASVESEGADVTLLSNDNSHPSHDEKLKRCRIDCSTLRRTALRRKYPSEEIAHRNMLARSKPHVSFRFRRFSDFLSEVGPKPFPGATLDRIDNSDPEYAPGKVRWADKHTQSNNRSTSRLFDDPDGNQYTVAELARRQDLTPSAIHQRLRRGWSYEEIVAGKRSSPKPASPPSPPSTGLDETQVATIFITIPDLKPVWLKEMDASYSGEWHDLSAREKKGLREIAERCAGPGLRLHVEEMVRSAIRNWSRLTACAKSREGAFGLPEKPTVDFLQKFIRVAVNLYLEDNNLEFRNSAVRPRETPCAPLQTSEADEEAQDPLPPAPAFQDMPYSPPGFAWDPNDWQALPPEQRERDFRKYVKNRLEPYHAEYTAKTGKLPPVACCCPLDVEAYFSYFRPPGWDDES
jgi:hypothetical protein